MEAEAPEHTAVGAPHLLGRDALNQGSATAPAQLSAAGAGGTGNFGFLPSPAGHCSLCPLPPAASHQARLKPLGKGSPSAGAGGSGKGSPIWGTHKVSAQHRCTAYRSLGLHLWSETCSRCSALCTHTLASTMLAVTMRCSVYCSPNKTKR